MQHFVTSSVPVVITLGARAVVSASRGAEANSHPFFARTIYVLGVVTTVISVGVLVWAIYGFLESQVF